MMRNVLKVTHLFDDWMRLSLWGCGFINRFSQHGIIFSHPFTECRKLLSQTKINKKYLITDNNNNSKICFTITNKATFKSINKQSDVGRSNITSVLGEVKNSPWLVRRSGHVGRFLGL